MPKPIDTKWRQEENPTVFALKVETTFGIILT